ncbi:endo alpha-1,4 polygalactosaminidase [Endozoicomonas sp. Mp262]|uniref:endo alpha-1,4 polygalactosaminidase n=1 Tax=Endozoicomonas sp. Mp262 TaxID=2919499 RepID=UPI0021D9458B
MMKRSAAWAKSSAQIINVFFLASILFAIPTFNYATDIQNLYPFSIISKDGSHSEQSLDVLKYKDQKGYDNHWPSYIEFTSSNKRYRGYIHFRVPANISLESMTLEVNYLGPETAYQRWRWAVLNYQEQKWQLLGTNEGALPWFWQNLKFELPGDPKQYISKKQTIQLRYWSNNGSDNSDIDYLSLSYVQKTVPAEAEDETGQDVPPDSNSSWWIPKPGTSWQWQLSGEIDTTISADIYNIDLFDAPVETIATLKQRGTKIICYFSAGSYENWRIDANNFPASILGKSNGWPGEQWLDIRRTDLIMPIMRKRLDLAVEKGCDAVEPDNIDGYSNNTGFSLNAEDQLNYNRLLATEAHARNLSIGLKNDLEQVNELLPWFDWALNESCLKYNECELLLPFIQQGKAVFHTEYYGSKETICPAVKQLGFSTLIKNRNLDPWRIDCLD